MQTGPVLRFDDFEMDIESGELRRRGRKVKLAPQPFRLLALLASSGGRVLDREAIRRQLWSGTFVDFEHGLNFCVREVRRALHDRAQRPRYIETMPRRGYRFVATVEARDTNGESSRTQRGVSEVRVGLADRLAEGRRLLMQMGVPALDQATVHFQAALAIDPACAMAHCGMGAARAMRFISRSEPGDLESAREHLERAVALDPELAEPYPWLCYVHMRRGNTEHAIALGERGVQYLPDLVHAHYFLGLVYFVSCEQGTGNGQRALEHLLEAGSLEPSWAPTWFVLASLLLLNGEYDAAERFGRRLFQYENLERPVTRFPGAGNLMGTIALRRGDLARASEEFTVSMTMLSASEHTYAEGMRAWCACGLGDVELRRGNHAQALARYRRAWQIVQESPGMLAQERHGTRALAGLAAAYAAAGEHDRARQILSQAEQRLPLCLDPQTSAAGAGLADLHYALAVACARVAEPAAISHLGHAFNAGWQDASWLQRDAEMDPLRTHPEFASLCEAMCIAAQPLGSTQATG